MPPQDTNNKRTTFWYLLRVLLLLSILLLAGLGLSLLQWELSTGKYSELTTAHRVEFGLVLTEYERSQALDESLAPAIKILSVLEFSQQCSIVLALAIYPRGGITSHSAEYYYTLQHGESDWLVTDVIRADTDARQPSC